MKDNVEAAAHECNEPTSEDASLSPMSPENLNELQQSFPFQSYIDKTECRAISLEQLKRVLDYAESRSPTWRHSQGPECGQTIVLKDLNLYHFNEWAILPATKHKDCAFVELMADGPQAPEWFVSHWWGEPILDFVRCLKEHKEVRELTESSPYWVCAYANRQHSLHQELASELEQTSFCRALLLAQGVLLVLNDESKHSSAATAFSRAWCVFEWYVAMGGLTSQNRKSMLFDMAALVDGEAKLLTDGLAGKEARSCLGTTTKAQRDATFPIHLIRKGLDLRIEQAQASRQEDRAQILNQIACNPPEAAPVENHENYDRLNCQLRSMFALAAWQQAVEKNLVEEMHLPAVLSRDTQRESINLDFGTCKLMDNRGLAMLSTGLPGSLKELRLDLGNCEHIGTIGVVALAGSLPASLTSLWLRLYNCVGVGNKALSSLSDALPSSLVNLILNFNGCNQIGDEGLVALSSKLPKKLGKLVLYFAGCTKIGDVGLSALGSSLPDLLHLETSFAGCPQISDAGLAAIACGLPESLQHLELHFLGCESIGNPGLAALQSAIPATLKTAEFRFYSTSVSESVLKSTEELDMFRSWQPDAGDIAAAKAAVKASSSGSSRHRGSAAASQSRRSSNNKSSAVSQRSTQSVMIKGCKGVLAVFQEFDESRSGFISRECLGDVLRRLSNDHSRRLSRKEIGEIFDAVDANKDGQIDYYEFIAWLARN